ncbi:MAG: CPBP family intramembrane glutamic endopeptidase [Gammaproteobacteria bacterium]
MRHLFAILMLLVLALVCGALLAVPVYKLLHSLADVRLHKLLPQVISITGFILLVAWLGYQNLLNRPTLGYTIRPGGGVTTAVLGGFVAGVLVIAVLAITLIVLGIHQLETDLEFDPVSGMRIATLALCTGIMVGLIEETLYRGALLGALLARMPPLHAVLASSVLYAAVHFLKFAEVPAGTPITWASGVYLLASAFYRFSEPAILDAFLSLLAFGILLSLVRIRSGVIYQCIGLHAGVVTAMRIVNKTTDYVPHNTLAFLVNRYDHMLGYLALLWLSACILVYYKFTGTEPGLDK